MFKLREFIKGKVFHICNKSIANFEIFKYGKNYKRFLTTLNYYNNSINKINLDLYLRNETTTNLRFNLLDMKESGIVKFLAYCVMPDHYHLLVKILLTRQLPKYISDVQNSFSRFFNGKFNRKGPLWQSRYRSVEIETNEQLLHVSRYIHLNPTTSSLVRKPEDWAFSSYKYYTKSDYYLKEVLNEITINKAERYRKFCENQIAYQRKLKQIRKLLLE
ncbi:MAG: transposase [bacterium]|nr:transposase [bacterium]